MRCFTPGDRQGQDDIFMALSCPGLKLQTRVLALALVLPGVPGSRGRERGLCGTLARVCFVM